MPPLRWPLLGAGLVFATGVLSCSGVQMGEPVRCEHDATCADGFICEAAVGKASVCVAAIECVGDGQCPVGSSCVERPDDPPDNAFEVESRGKSVCDCLSDCGTGGFNGGGQGGEPAGGQGGQGGAP